MLDEHDGCVRDIHADFNNRGRNHHINLAGGKRFHGAFFIVTLHPAMK